MFRILSLILAVLMSVISVVVVYYNNIPYTIDFNIIQFSEIPFGVALFIAMIFGVRISLFFLIGLLLSMRKKYKKLKKDHDLINKEVQNLRRIPIQE